MKISSVFLGISLGIIMCFTIIIIDKPWILNRWFSSIQRNEELIIVEKYKSAKFGVERLVAELPFLENENLQMSQLLFEKERMRQCGYPYKQPNKKQQRISFDCNTKFYIKRYNELSEQYMTGKSDHE